MSKTLTAVDYRRVAAIQAKIDSLEAKKQKILAGVTVGKKAAKTGTKKGKKPVSDARAKAQQKRRANERKAAKLAAAKKTGEK
jgi:hypothetical protein